MFHWISMNHPCCGYDFLAFLLVFLTDSYKDVAKKLFLLPSKIEINGCPSLFPGKNPNKFLETLASIWVVVKSLALYWPKLATLIAVVWLFLLAAQLGLVPLFFPIIFLCRRFPVESFQTCPCEMMVNSKKISLTFYETNRCWGPSTHVSIVCRNNRMSAVFVGHLVFPVLQETHILNALLLLLI